MKKTYIFLNALLLSLTGWLLQGCKSSKKAVKDQPATKVEAVEDPQEEPMLEESDTTRARGRDMRVLYGPPASFRQK